MKLLRYGPAGAEKPGRLDDEGRIRDLSGVVTDIAGPALLADGLAAIAAVDPASLPLVPDGVRIGPCVGAVGKFICIGLNYSDHAAEVGKTVPPEPVMFMKATSSICGPNDDIVLPRGSEKTDWEVELAAVIGRPAKYVSEADALDHVAGYCTVNDISERDFQLHRQGQWTKGKSCDTFGPVGPWLVTADEVADIDDLKLFCEVEGKRYQDGSTATMHYRVPFLISYLSRFFTLQPGDIIATGTPPGVGNATRLQTYLKPGQTVRTGVEGLGIQVQRVVQG